MIVAIPYTGQAGQAGKQDWLILENEHIPAEQQQCTVADIKDMMALARIGRPALSHTSKKCPVSRRPGSSGSVIASYRATLLVHRSISLENKYELTASAGKLSAGQTILRQKKTEIDLKSRQSIQLGWLPAVPPQYGWGRIFSNGTRVFIPKNPEQENGFLYFDQAYSGVVWVHGPAIVDKYFLDIEHKQGSTWDKTILVTAEWGPEDENGNRESVQIEVKLPICVEGEFNKCSSTILVQGPEGKDQEEWNVFFRRASYKVSIGACSGAELKVETV